MKKILGGLDVRLPYIRNNNSSAWKQYTIQVNKRDQLQKTLSKLNVPTAIHYPLPLYQQPAMYDASIELK